MSRLFESLKNAADGAFVVDEDLRIICWNSAAEAILGIDSDCAIGQFCYQLLHGCDERSRLICKARCWVLKLALESIPVPNYDLQVKTKHGDNRWVNMSIFTYRLSDSDDKKMIVHLFHELNHQTVNEKLLTHLVNAVKRYEYMPSKNGGEMKPHLETLTPREHETLTLLAKGNSTSEIGERLSISQNTVRNHVQHILQKFQVHSRLEAVTYALKNDLII